MSVRPVLLGLYEKYFLPLQKLLLPSLQAFIVGLLPGLEEGSEIYDRWVSSSADGGGTAGGGGVLVHRGRGCRGTCWCTAEGRWGARCVRSREGGAAGKGAKVGVMLYIAVVVPA